jgi:dolichol-phosphate mannosyltransferase
LRRLRDWWDTELFAVADPRPRFQSSWPALLSIFFLSGLLLFPNLSYALIEPDEGRYAEISREMLGSGNWIVPTLNHEPFDDKPPLLYWLVAFSLKLMGPKLLAARMVPATAAFGTVLATFWFGRRVLGWRAALLGASVLTSMAGFVQCGRFLVTDGLLALTESLALFTAYEAIQGERLAWNWWICSSVCCALGVLTKGPIALVCVTVPVAAFSLLNRRRACLHWLHWCGYLALTLMLAAPWYIAIMARQPSFGSLFFFEHHLMRFFGSAFHEEPFWFYLPVVLVGCMPWSVLLFPLAHFLVKTCPAFRCRRPRALGFLVLWVGWSLLFFSTSRGKLPTYILPATPAIALLMGWYLDIVLFKASRDTHFDIGRFHVPRWTVAILCATWIVGDIWARSSGLLDSSMRRIWLPIECAVGLGALMMFATRVWQAPRAAWLLTSTLGLLLVIVMSQVIVPGWSSKRSPLAEVRSSLKEAGIATLDEPWGSVPFELDNDKLFCHVTGPCMKELSKFLASHHRDLVFTKDDLDPSTLRSVIPSDHELAAVIHSGKAYVLVISQIPLDHHLASKRQ